MTEEIANRVTVVGRLVERPDFTETETGECVARFWLANGSNQVECFASGVTAESLLRFGKAGVEILGHGHLRWFHGDTEQPYVFLDRLGFTTPTELAELMEHGL